MPMKVSLIRIPTIIDFSASTAPVTPPIGLAYLKGIVSDFTNEIQVIDSVGNFPQIRTINDEEFPITLLGQTKDQIASLLDKNTEIILVSCMFSQDWDYAKKIFKEIRLKCPKSMIIAGGEHITALPKYSMETAPEIDVCVLGEGETILQNILQSIESNGSIDKNLPGTCLRHKDGEIIQNIKQSRIKDLVDSTWPDWEGFPLENYFSEGHGFGVSFGGRTMPILASRGCPYECTFCSNPLMWTTYWNVRNPEDVYNEMKLYVEKYQITNFDFYDLTAIVKKQWIVDFCKLLIKNYLNVIWQLPSGTRSEAIDGEVAFLLKQAGCRNLSYAPESGSPEILELIKKNNGRAVLTNSKHKTGTDRVFEVFEKQLESKPEIIINFQGDMPNLNPNEIKNLAQHMKKNLCDIGTLASHIENNHEEKDPNVVKVVVDREIKNTSFAKAVDFIRISNRPLSKLT